MTSYERTQALFEELDTLLTNYDDNYTGHDHIMNTLRFVKTHLDPDAILMHIKGLEWEQAIIGLLEDPYLNKQ